MDEDAAPTYPPPPAPRRGVGSYTKGCLGGLAVLLLLGLLLGAGLWYVARSLLPFLGEEPVAVRVFPATDEQYAAVRAKVDPFLDAARAGQSPVVNLTADDLNILIARDPLFAGARGKVYFTIHNHQVTAETSLLANEELGAAATQMEYFNARVGFDASFAGGDLTVVLRQLEPLNGKPTPGLVISLLGNRDFSYNVTYAINEKFHARMPRYPVLAEMLSRVRQAIVKDDQIVLTGVGMPPPPVAVPAKTE